MQTSSVRAEIDESCETLIWITTGIFLISIFLSILRPEPTLAVCLFGFYGAHTHSKGEPARALRRTPHRRVSLGASDAGAVRAFWVYLLVSVLIDALWLYQYSALQPFTWEQMQQMTRREQVAVALTAVNVLYKLVVVGVSVRLQMLLGAFEAAELQGDRPGDTSAAGGTSNGGRAASGSLAAQARQPARPPAAGAPPTTSSLSQDASAKV